MSSKSEYMKEYNFRKKSGTFIDRRIKNNDLIDYCLNCGNNLGKPRRRNKRRKFCNNDKCQHDYARKKAIENGIAGNSSTKRYLIDLFGHKCMKCNNTEWLDKPITLDLHHKDGNWNDNSPENTELLCPNCHSYTDNYKSKNKGNGRGKKKYIPKPFYPKFLNPLPLLCT